jgi:hypothetical protein
VQQKREKIFLLPHSATATHVAVALSKYKSLICIIPFQILPNKLNFLDKKL